MSALLSPAKPVRTRFKVPGEGAYELHTDIPPPVPRSYPAQTTPQSQQSPPAKPSPPPYPGGSLGLPKLTLLSFAARAALHPEPPPANTPPRPPSPVSAPSSTLFSFRKLTSLSLGKLSSASVEDEPSDAVTSVTATPRVERDEVGGLRAPPRVAPPDHPSTVQISPANNAGVLCYNAADVLVLLDMATRASLEFPLSTSARAPPSCHSLVSREGLRLIVGCCNGEVLYYSDIVAAASASDSRRSRAGVGSGVAASVASVVNGPSAPAAVVYNKDGTLNVSRVVALRWFPYPASSLRFVSVHADGGVVVHDARHRPVNAPSHRSTSSISTSTSTSNEEGCTKPSEGRAEGSDKLLDRTERDRERSGLSTGSVEKHSGGAPSHRRSGSVANSSTNVVSSIGVAIGQHEVLLSKLLKGKRGSATIVWQIGRATLTSCDFSPTCTAESSLLAVTGRDGYLRVIDLQREVPLIAFRSYFGAFLCVAWSPDGKYVATGGEDDLVSIWCPSEERLVARLEGHTSWVSAVAWDESLCHPTRYRVGSAGQDCKLLLWDFSLDALHLRSPQRTGSRTMRLRSYRREASNGSAAMLPSAGVTSNGVVNGFPPPMSASGSTPERKPGKLSRLRGHGAGGQQTSGGDSDNVGIPSPVPLVIPAQGRADIPTVEPVVAHIAHGEPLTDIWFQEGGLFTADAVGGVKMWSRPPQYAVPELSLGQGPTQDGIVRRSRPGDLD